MAEKYKIKKVTEFPQASSLEGFYAFGTDGSNNSVKVPITMLEGNKGDTPIIGDNGNWWINGIDTGQTAQSVPNNKTIFNVSQYNNKYDYIDSTTARNAIPANLRGLGQQITYKLASGKWVTEQYTSGSGENSSETETYTFVSTQSGSSFFALSVTSGSTITGTTSRNGVSGSYSVSLSKTNGAGDFQYIVDNKTGNQDILITANDNYSFIWIYGNGVTATITKNPSDRDIYVQKPVTKSVTTHIQRLEDNLNIVRNLINGDATTTLYLARNISFFGDSITDTAYHGEWIEALPNYLRFKSMSNHARGWCTWCHKADTSYNITDNSDANIGNNVIWNQANKLIASVNNGLEPIPDVVCILAGTNDFLQKKPQGDPNTVFDLSVNYLSLAPNDPLLLTTAGAIRYTCETIWNTFPFCQIILCTPLQSGDSTTPYEWIFNVQKTVQECAKYLSTKVIDQTTESGIYKKYEQNPTSTHKYTKDGTHLNDRGGDLVAKFMAKKLYTEII